MSSCIARRHLRPVLLEEPYVEDRQNARCTEDGEADKPRQLAVTRTLPQGDSPPYSIPDRQEDYHGDKQDKQRTFHDCSLVDGFTCLAGLICRFRRTCPVRRAKSRCA